jgi:hypothetical protein
MNALSFGGLVFEGENGNSYVNNVASGVTVTTVDSGAEGVRLFGGAGNDVLTGAAGSDTLNGGAGNDTLSAGVATEVRTFDLGGQLAADVTFAGFNWLGLGNLTLDEAVLASTVGTNWAVVDGAGLSVVGAQLATLLNSNLTQVNADWQTAYATPSEVITAVSYANGVLTFTFQSGTNVVNPINLGYAANGDTGTFTVSAETTAAQGGNGGNNLFRGGLGTDVVNGGAGNDTIVVAGTWAAADYAAGDQGAALDDVLSNSELTSAKAVSDITGAEVMNGGAGVDTLEIFGTVNLTGTTLSNIEVLSAHSTVIMTKAQLALFSTLQSNGDDIIINISDLGAGETNESVLMAWLSEEGNSVDLSLGGGIKLGDGGVPISVVYHDFGGVAGVYAPTAALLDGATDVVKVFCSDFDAFAGKGETVQAITLPALGGIAGQLTIENFVIGSDTLTFAAGTTEASLANAITGITALLGETVQSIGDEGSDTYVSFALDLAAGGTVFLNNIINIDSLLNPAWAATLEGTGSLDVSASEALLIGTLVDSITNW